MKLVCAFPTAVAASVLIGIGLFVGLGSFLGCAADRVTAPDRTWEEVRYHWSQGQGGGEYGDLTIRSSGDMVWVLQGQGASTRGLLAGENLETLARLIDALPSAGYVTAVSCDRHVFVTVTSPEGRKDFATGDCDAAAPAELEALVTHLDRWVVDATAHRRDPVSFRVLAEGAWSRPTTETRRVAKNRDELLSLIDLVGAERIGPIAAVDFRREIVMGIFLGSRPSDGYQVDVTGAYKTEENQLVLTESWFVPDAGCPVARTATSPFVLVAVGADKSVDFLSEVETTVRPCGAALGAR